MAGHNVILDAVKDDPTETIRDLVQMIHLLDAGDTNYKKYLDSLKARLPPKKEESKPTQFEFNPAVISLPDWLLRLRRANIQPIVNVHYRETKDCSLANEAELSYLQDETREGVAAQDELRSQRPEATQDELRQAYDRAAMAARRHNARASQQAPMWTPLRRETGNDVRSEDSLIIYLSGKKDLDWHATIRNLRDFGTRHGYDLAHYKNCLDRFVSFFSPTLRPVTAQMDANTMARFLSSLTMPDSDFDMIESQIKSLTRPAGEKVRLVMSHLLALAQTLYKNNKPDEKKALIEKMMVVKAAAVEGRAPAQRAAVQGGQSLCHQAGPGPVQYLFRRGHHLLSHYFNKNNLD